MPFSHLPVYVFALLALPGCTFSTQLQHIAVSQNQVVASTADSITLINILRASERLPLHFTSISRISGNVDFGASGGLGAGVALRGPGVTSLSPTLGGSFASNPSFDITVHDSQSFQRGVMAPIEPEIINYYLGVDWPPDLLTYLLVDRVDFVASDDTVILGRGFKPGEVIASIRNDPSSLDGAGLFRDFVRCYTLSALRQPDLQTPLVKFSEVKPTQLAELAILDGTKFDLGPGPKPETHTDLDWVVRTIPGGQAVGLEKRSSESCVEQDVVLRGGAVAKAQIGRMIAGTDPRKATFVATIVDGQANQTKATIEITFRSVSGVIYFLGEYVRASDDGRTIYTIRRLENSGTEVFEPLLLIVPGRGEKSDISAELRGVSWHIPYDRPSRSYQVISIVGQLFNLQKLGTSSPLSTAVRVVN